MAKEPNELKWIESMLPQDSYRRKGMFGGFAYYIDERIVLLMFESPGDSTYRGQKYPFELWNGCMFPVEHELQAKALKQFPFLICHPVLPKWLYLPLHTENFDDLVTEVLAQATKPASFWGSVPKRKSKKAISLRTVTDIKISSNIDTRKPRMFSDQSAEVVLQSAEKISDLKNLGSVSEKEFHRAGIKTAQRFIQLGWQKTLKKLVTVNSKNRHSIFAYALIGALTNKEWNRISDDEKQQARDFVKTLPENNKKKKSRK